MHPSQQSPDQIIDSYHTSLQGLSNSEAQIRLKKDGPNRIIADDSINLFVLFFSQFKNFIIYILLVATILSFVAGHYTDGIVILIILLINASIGFFQELSAHKSLEALKKIDTPFATVKRDGEIKKIASYDLVVGDLVLLESGDTVPADGRIVFANRCKAQESALTGESLSVEKKSETLSAHTSLGDQINMVFAGTHIVEGIAHAIITSTGINTEIGKITALVQATTEEQTPLQRKLDTFGKKLAVIVLGICVGIVIISMGREMMSVGFQAASFVSIGLIAVALAVSAVPEGLPAVVTVVLSIGVKRLFKKKALVRRLASVETLGSCDVICSDKTGTLTQNKMTVVDGWVYDHHENSLADEPLLYQIGAVCNNAIVKKETEKPDETIGDPTEIALVYSADVRNVSYKHFVRHDEIPFDSERKMMSVMVSDASGNYMIMTKGSVDHLLEKATHILINKKIEVLTSYHRTIILEQNKVFSSQAFRVLACAYKPATSHETLVENELVFVGLQAMIDPPRDEVIDAIRVAKQAGIQTIMITGDHADTASAIGKMIGIEGNVITGQELEALSEKELQNILQNNTRIFARVIPEQKQKIITALQALGHTVAMTGDGVNDAPALKKADIGIAVGSGTDVAKQASDIVLLDDSFATIVYAIEEGRGIFDNIQKVILHLFSGNLAEVMIVVIAVLLGWNLPLTAIFLLWINLITDGLPALALSVDPYDRFIMNRKPVSKDTGIISPSWWRFIIVMGIGMTAILLGIFYTFGGMTDNTIMIRNAQAIVFAFFVLAELLLLLMIRSTYQVPLFANKWLWGTLIMSIGLQAMITFTSLNRFFNLDPLSVYEIMWLVSGLVVFFLVFKAYQFFCRFFVQTV